MIRTITIPDLNFDNTHQTENYITRQDHSYDSFAGSGEASIVCYEFHQKLYYITCSSCTLPFRSDILFLHNSLLLQHISLLNVYTLMLHVYIRTLPLYTRILHVYIRTLPLYNRMLHVYNRTLPLYNHMLHVYNQTLPLHNRMLHVYNQTLPLHNRILQVYNQTLPLYNRMLNICIKAFSTAQNNYTIRRNKISILLYINVLKTTDQILRSIQQWIFNPFSVSKPVFLPINYYLQCRCRSYLQIVTTYKIYIGESINISEQYFIFSH